MTSSRALTAMINHSYLTLNARRNFLGIQPVTESDIPWCVVDNDALYEIAVSPPLKTPCGYCSRPNDANNEVCKSCGAPTPIVD